MSLDHLFELDNPNLSLKIILSRGQSGHLTLLTMTCALEWLVDQIPNSFFFG